VSCHWFRSASTALAEWHVGCTQQHPTLGLTQVRVSWRRYVTVDKLAGRALYYVFVEAKINPETSPVLLWLNGYAARLVALAIRASASWVSCCILR
jgi:hypothetical protein